MSPSPAAVQSAPNKGSDSNRPAILIPFTRAAKEHEEPFYDSTLTLSANTVQVGPVDIPAYGYLRSVKILVEAVGGAGSAAVAAADGPFSALNEVSLIDVNGAPIVGPISGYDSYITNKYLGFRRPLTDAKQHPSYSAIAATGNFAFMTRLNLETNQRDAVGALANQNASSQYKVRFTLSNIAGIYSTPPTTVPTVRVRMWIECWTQPAGADLRGFPQATTPPAHGTTSYISKTTWNVPQGNSTQRINRVGNYIRGLIFVHRESGARVASTNWPDPVQLSWDTRLLNNFGSTNWKDLMAERHQLAGAVGAAGGIDLGVYVYDFAHEFDGRVGDELRDGWLPTVQSTRLDFQGTFGAAATVDVITNDVSPAGEVFT